MRGKTKLLDEFVLFTLVEPVFTVLLGLAGVIVAIVRLSWTVLLGFLLIGWISETVLALIAWNERGLIFWFYFGGIFLAGLIAKRIATFPVKKGAEWVMAGGLKRRVHDEPFADVPDHRPVIQFAASHRA
ncbi:hypothetical protein [Acidocella sp.]|uniref:hypothetical protein n=1 Tax=Acidocella sp. TaxID=50710 RepID=UPI003CFECE0A